MVQEIAETLGLSNVTARHTRAEEVKERFDFVITRGVAPLDKLLAWSRPLLKKKHLHAMPNGLIALKGGDLRPELDLLHRNEYVETWRIADFFKEPFFEGKFVLYVQG